MTTTVRGVAVTGTDTGVGKTIVAAVLTCVLEATYVKPVQSGTDDGDDDAGTVARLTGRPTLVGPSLGEPLAPSVAARRAGIEVTAQELLEPVRQAAQRHPGRPLVVEGAGGILVELGTDGTDLSAIADAFDLPTVVVARPGLGTLNHTLLTLEALDRRGRATVGVIVSGYPARPDVATATNLAELDRLSGGRLVGVVPKLDIEPLHPDRCRRWVAPTLGGTWQGPDREVDA